MAIDIVTRLREDVEQINKAVFATKFSGSGVTVVAVRDPKALIDDLDEAAHEIESLRNALRSIRGWREIGSADASHEKLRAIEGICDLALPEDAS